MSNLYLSSLGQPPNICASATACPAARKRTLAKLACAFTCQLVVGNLAEAITDNAETRRF
jgi:hypothetical protein